jgi:hypothetical protein
MHLAQVAVPRDERSRLDAEEQNPTAVGRKEAEGLERLSGPRGIQGISFVSRGCEASISGRLPSRRASPEERIEKRSTIDEFLWASCRRKREGLTSRGQECSRGVAQPGEPWEAPGFSETDGTPREPLDF